MRKSLIFATLFEVRIIFGKESFINAMKGLNFIQSPINEEKAIKSLTAFHRYMPELQIGLVDGGRVKF